MSMPKKPLWTDGLFLEPNHLQQQDRYHERLLALRVASLRARDWGVLESAIDPQALQGGEIRVQRLRAVLPDGTLLTVGGELDDVLAPRPIDGLRGGTAPVDVYVALAHENAAGANVELGDDRASPARFLRVESDAADFNTGRDARVTPWVRHNLQLLFGDEHRDRHDSLRIAQLVRAPSGALVVREAFVAPSLRVSASPFLVAGFHRVLSAMTAKQQALSASRRQRSATTVEFQASDSVRFWLLHTLNQKIPTIAQIAHDPQVHPDEAHRELAELLGALCTFDTEANPLSIPNYDHLDAGRVFEAMFAMAQALLERLIAERFVQIPLEPQSAGYYLGQLRDPAIVRHAFYLAVSGGYTPAQLREHVPRLTKIASTRQIGAIVNSALNGASLTFEQYPPGALPLKADVVFFRLETASDFWTDMVTSGTIAVYQPFDPSTVRLALYAVDPSTLQ
jgi:type VI secretion system protein ImpJ